MLGDRSDFAPPPTGRGNPASLAGQLLVAMPGMPDPRFAETVVCLCAHGPEGAMGLVLNKPIEDLSFDDLVRQLELAPTPPARRIRLLAGGPVEGSRGFVLHTAEWETEGTLPVADWLSMTASVDVLKEVAVGRGPRQAVLALGYAGWGPGQLEAELQRNAWLTVPADEALLFGEEEALPGRRGTHRAWRAALARLNIDPLLLSSTAGRA
ncbi:MAG: YqgE/AlgH family protein [Acetobacteraceae bacterium]|nr:YqgE/AlgH family protein [Acetobacteraceae bacterium]